MAIKDRIKEARLRKKYTQEYLASLIGVAKSTVTGYEKGNSEPSIEIMGRIMNALDVDANYLWQDEGDFPMQVSHNEMQHIKKYRDLDPHGKEHVNTILDWESQRVIALKEAQKIHTPQAYIAPTHIISYYQRLASAGIGEYLFPDIPTDTIEVMTTPVSEQADFAIGVNGDSMEPTYFDGDKLFVKKAEEIPTGSIGIFVRGGECFIKELGVDRLISHNKAWPDVPASEDIRVVGLVLGKVEEV